MQAEAGPSHYDLPLSHRWDYRGRSRHSLATTPCLLAWRPSILKLGFTGKLRLSPVALSATDPPLKDRGQSINYQTTGMSGNERKIKNLPPPQSWLLLCELPPFSAGTSLFGPPQPMAFHTHSKVQLACERRLFAVNNKRNGQISSLVVPTEMSVLTPSAACEASWGVHCDVGNVRFTGVPLDTKSSWFGI